MCGCKRIISHSRLSKLEMGRFHCEKARQNSLYIYSELISSHPRFRVCADNASDRDVNAVVVVDTPTLASPHLTSPQRLGRREPTIPPFHSLLPFSLDLFTSLCCKSRPPRAYNGAYCYSLLTPSPLNFFNYTDRLKSFSHPSFAPALRTLPALKNFRRRIGCFASPTWKLQMLP